MPLTKMSNVTELYLDEDQFDFEISNTLKDAEKQNE